MNNVTRLVLSNAPFLLFLFKYIYAENHLEGFAPVAEILGLSV